MLNGPLIVAAGYLNIEIILSIWKDVLANFSCRLFGMVRHLRREQVYLRGILREQRSAQWKPETKRYVVLRATKAQKGGGASSLQPFQARSASLKHQGVLWVRL
jgi:hypothetical protein